MRKRLHSNKPRKPWQEPQEAWKEKWMRAIGTRLTYEQGIMWHEICARCGTSSYDALQAYALSVIKAGTISRSLRHSRDRDKVLLMDAVPPASEPLT